jgi:hypothetical protein
MVKSTGAYSTFNRVHISGKYNVVLLSRPWGGSNDAGTMSRFLGRCKPSKTIAEFSQLPTIVASPPKVSLTNGDLGVLSTATSCMPSFVSTTQTGMSFFYCLLKKMESTLKICLAVLVGIFVTLYWHLSTMSLPTRLQQKRSDDEFQRQKCMDKQDMVCVDYYDRKLFTLNDIYNQNHQHFNEDITWMPLIVGGVVGVSASQLALPMVATLAGVSFGLYWYESHYTSLETIVGRDGSNAGQSLQTDAAVIAYDCHSIASSPHPKKDGTHQRYVEPIESCVKRRTSQRLEQLQRLGFMPAIDVLSTTT